MILLLRIVVGALILVALSIAALAVFGPREPVRTDIAFDPARLSDGVSPYLAAQEGRFDDITPGVEKRVAWAGAPEDRAPLALVYIHGFSATSEELRPLPDEVAQELGANLVFTRLAGHGRGGAAMAEPRVEDWMADVAEALAIGRAVGDRVVVLAASTGATLATLAAFEAMAEGVAGLVLIAPNYKIAAPRSALLTWPAARWWLPATIGAERGFEPRSEGQARYWTTRYPSVAVLPMAAAVKAARDLPFARATIPALFVFDPDDRVVDHARTRAVAEAWGAPATVHAVSVGPGDDPDRHVIAGDLLSPDMTGPLAARIADWIRDLP